MTIPPRRPGESRGQMVKILVALLVATAVLNGCASAGSEPVLGGSCEGCENVFIDIPKVILSTARIAPEKEQGEMLVLEGTVRDSGGIPTPGIIVYAYQTDAEGLYPKGSTRHGALRGWALTDAKGGYRFDTIRPAPYPGGNIPQHIHMHVIEPGRGTYYIDDVIFDDDPILTAKNRPDFRHGRGGYGECHPVRDAQGAWRVRRDIILGRSIPGYPPR